MKKKRINYVLMLCLFIGFLLSACENEKETPVLITDQEVSESLTQEEADLGKQETADLLEQEEAASSEALEKTPDPLPPDSPKEFVKVKEYIPGIYVELKYHTTDNFTGKQIYDFSECYLRYGTVEKLAKVQNELNEQGLSLKIWDGFRPVKAQFVLWETYPDPTYVANPKKGYSSHSRGNTVDVTLVKTSGEELRMPTGFDNFSSKADRDYDDCGKEETANAKMLEKLMKKYGFKPYFGEWWHFTDEVTYEVEKEFNISE